ncbi:cadherin-AgCad1-like [Arctopsyche grandis]|uniref:cadherin-AgCad1-like n=1 Tax=Arctopsyche grandis TaxID=121162 RepID=UPI00406D853F
MTFIESDVVHLLDCDNIIDKFAGSKARKEQEEQAFQNSPATNPGHFTPEQLSEIKKLTMSRLICDNIDHIELLTQAPNAFIYFIRPDVPGNEPIECSGRAQIGQFDLGNNRDLGAVVKKRETDPEDEYWYIIVEKRQDYEIFSMQRYIINIEIVEGSDMRSDVIFLDINNIDDNPPFIQLSPCDIPELYEGLSNCTYTVTDADGAISINVMTFKIDENSIEKDLFQFVEKRFNDDAFKMEITINVIKQLDFDKIQLHIFTLEAFDSLPNIGTAKLIVQLKDMPPKWTSIFATQRFNEKTSQNFKLTAIDGDTQINIPIKNRLNDAGNEFEFIHTGEDSGILVVDPIDRDAEERETFFLDHENESVICMITKLYQLLQRTQNFINVERKVIKIRCITEV